MNVHKTCGVWFPKEKLGMANGIVSMGMALGFLCGSLLAATVLSPLLGGWRHVLFAYGGVAVLFGIFWWRTQEKSDDEDDVGERKTDFREAVLHVMQSRNVWLFCIATACVSGCVNGMLGFLPLYLRNLGWAPVAADSTLASFHAMSMVFAIPVALLSDRLGSRRGVLITATAFICIGTGFLGVAHGILIPVAVLTAGLFRDGFMAINMTAIIEVKGIGARFAGTAIGLSLSAMGIANVFSPPIGNWMERFGSGAPFLFWSSLAVVSLVCYLSIRRTGG
jgi:cyanate permease